MDIKHNETLSKAIREAWPNLTRSDKKISVVITGQYPIACLETLAELAARAEVSAPSVIRFIRKLGYDSYPEFQRTIHMDIHRALTEIETRKAKVAVADEPSMIDPFVESIRDAINSLHLDEVDAAARALAGARDSVLCVGGRISQALAGIFQAHLSRMRPNVEMASSNPVERAERLLDVTGRDSVLIFDYAPYEIDICSFAQLAAEKGASLVLFTDSGTSPIAQFADFVVSCSPPAMNEYRSLVPALAQLELLVQQIEPMLQRKAKARTEGLLKMTQLKASFKA
ncbi:MAG: MurR/RpiR family transcriptional regulator [Lysobacterales bacterium]